MKTKPNTPTATVNDAAAMRDVFASKLADAIAEHDLHGMAVYDDCVNYWSRKAEFLDDGVSRGSDLTL